MKELFFFLTLILYVLSFVGFTFYFKTLRKDVLRYSQGLLAIGFAFHCAYWITRGYEIYLRASLFFGDALNFLAWSLVLVYFIFTVGRIKIYTTGFFLMPLVLILLFLTELKELRIESPFESYLKNLWFPLHAIAGLVSHAFLLFGVIAAIMYLLQEREIKQKKLGIFFKKLPPLEYLDRTMEKALYLGFIFLTIAMLSGAMWSDLVFGDYWVWSPKQVITFILWIVYAILIHQRVLIGWRGKKTAQMLIMGFCLWAISFFVVSLCCKGFHSYAY